MSRGLEMLVESFLAAEYAIIVPARRCMAVNGRSQILIETSASPKASIALVWELTCWWRDNQLSKPRLQNLLGKSIIRNPSNDTDSRTCWFCAWYVVARRLGFCLRSSFLPWKVNEGLHIWIPPACTRIWRVAGNQSHPEPACLINTVLTSVVL